MALSLPTLGQWIVFVSVTLLSLVVSAQGSNTDIDQKVQSLLGKMTLEEKVAQMRIFHARLGVSLSDDDALVLSDEVKAKLKLGIAGIKNPGEFESPRRAAIKNNLLQRYIIEHNRHGIPALFVTEAYNGVDAEGTTKFARPINQASTWNPALIQSVWDVMGREARMRGMHMCHSPEADIMRDPRFGRMSEAFSEDTHLTTEMVVAAVRGVQGDGSGLARTHIGAVTKHFAGYGQVDGGRNFASATISPPDLIDEIFPPFKAAVQRGNTLGIMASHGDINGVASHGNRQLLVDTLRDTWGFTGYTVSDANDIARLHFFMGVAENEDEAALMGLNAGVDIDLYSEDAYSRLPRLAREDPSLLPLIDQAAGRVLKTKYRLGLFDQPYLDVDFAEKETKKTRSLDLALAVDLESVILLKNNGILPLDIEKTKTIALVGPLLSDKTLVQFKKVWGKKVSLVAEKGFELTNGGKDIPRLASEASMRKGVNSILNAVKNADVVIAFVGGDEFTAKEAYFNKAYGDRATIEPVGLQDALISELKATGKPVIIALKHRRTLAINRFAQDADAILDAWELSERGDEALALLIKGDAVPSGKLPVTVPRTIGQIPFHYSQKDINFKKGYLFVDDGPLFPFGFGLSYSTFRYDAPSLSVSKITPLESLSVSIEVTNTGRYSAKETVQLYIRDEIGSVLRPRKVLKAFKKIYLKAGESRELMFDVTPEMLTMTGNDLKPRVEPGKFHIEIGGASEGGKIVSFVVVEPSTDYTDLTQ